MTDKKRLEEAKLMAEMLRVETRLPHDFPFDLVDWLAEQTERVQELEEELVKYRNSFELQLLINNSIKNQIKRYREALEFYADEEHYKEKLISVSRYDADGICISNDEYAPPIIYFDSGEKARKALEGEE